MFGLIHETAVEQFQKIDAGTRLVFIQPSYLQSHLIFNQCADEDVLYVRFEGHELTSAQLHEQLNQEVQVQTGRADLLAVKTLLLDEFDRSQKDARVEFLHQLMARSDNGRIIIVSRSPMLEVLKDDHLHGLSRFIPVDDGVMLPDYTLHANRHKTHLEVRALGRGRVLLNGELINDWDGLLPRSLFFYLVDRGMTTRNDIFETFWPTLPIREATNVFHVTKRKISEVLGVDLTHYGSGFYHISDDIDLSYDVVTFSQHIHDSAIADNEKAVALLRRAVALYRNDFLNTLDAPWIERRRQELRQTYGEALINLARIYQGQGEDQKALGLYTRALATNPKREDVVHHIMTLYQNMGMPDDALSVYEFLEQQLANTVNVAPTPRLQELAETIRVTLNR